VTTVGECQVVIWDRDCSDARDVKKPDIAVEIARSVTGKRDTKMIAQKLTNDGGGNCVGGGGERNERQGQKQRIKKNETERNPDFSASLLG
jgi:hypothetical protein